MPEKRTVPPEWLMAREWPIDSREWKAKWAWEMRVDAGMGVLEIGEALGVGRSMASDLMTDPTGDAARARKRKRHGICEDCGTKTFNGGSLKLSKRCHACQVEKDRAQGAETKARVAEQVREWARIHGEPPRIADWSPAHAALGYRDDGTVGADYVKFAEAVAAAERNRAEGWPSTGAVLYHWGVPDGWTGPPRARRRVGSWELAMDRIGVGRRRYAQARKGVDPAEVVRLYEAGLMQKEIAVRMGLSPTTVRFHLLRQGALISNRARVRVDRAEAVRLYLTGLTMKEVAERLGCSVFPVWQAVRDAGVARSSAASRQRAAA